MKKGIFSRGYLRKNKMPPKNKKSKKKERTLEDSLKDPVYVSYHTLLKLEEIKKINYAILEILNTFHQRMLAEETPEVKPKKKKEEREGTLSSKR